MNRRSGSGFRKRAIWPTRCKNSKRLAGQYPKALERAQRAVDIRREILGDRHHLYADSLSWLGVIYQQLGSLCQGGGDFKQNISIYKECGERHPDYGTP